MTKLNTFKPLSNTAFKAALISAQNKTAEYIAAVQSLAETCVYYALRHNESRKADQVMAMLDSTHQRKFMAFVTNHSNLAFATKQVKDEYKLARNKDWDNSRYFFIDKPTNCNDVNHAQAVAFEAGNTVSSLSWITYKAPKLDTVKPLDIVAALDRLDKRMASDKYAPVDDLEERQALALGTFLDLIKSGVTANDFEASIRKSLMNELKAKSTANLPVIEADQQSLAL